LDNIDQLITNLEFKQVEIQVVNSLKVGNESLKKLHQLMSLDEIEDIMDDTRDAIEHQRVNIKSKTYFFSIKVDNLINILFNIKKIDELLSSNMNDEEMDEINKELDDIIKMNLPEIPSQDVSVPAQKDKQTVKPGLCFNSKKLIDSFS
jgi:charged multivesicular body protein 6